VPHQVLLTISTYPDFSFRMGIASDESPSRLSRSGRRHDGGACAPRYVDADYAVAQPSGPYRLASGDRLRIIVFGQDNLSNIYAVDGAAASRCR
jgi:hypothetical protein